MAEEGAIEATGASLPDGIEVDEAAAYFGVTESSDIIVRLNQSDRLNGLGEFLSLTVDLVLKDEFDFQSAASRIGCEDGEVYYLLSGPFGLLTVTDPLRRYLGQPDSEGETGPHPGIPENEIAALDQLNDVMVLMRMVAIAHLVGGLRLLDHTLVTFEAWMMSPGAHKQQLLALCAELDNALNEAKAGSISPLHSLGVPTAAPAPQPAPQAPAPQPAVEPQPAPTPVHAPIQPTVQPQPAPAPVQPLMPPQPAPVVSAPPPQPVSSPTPAPVSPSPQPSPTTHSVVPALSTSPVEEQAPEEIVTPPSPDPSALPQPVAPARAPVASAQPAPASTAPNSESAQDRVADLVSRPGATAEGVHHHIQSGRFCGGCGIGVEQQWRHCPVCSTSL